MVSTMATMALCSVQSQPRVTRPAKSQLFQRRDTQRVRTFRRAAAAVKTSSTLNESGVKLARELQGLSESEQAVFGLRQPQALLIEPSDSSTPHACLCFSNVAFSALLDKNGKAARNALRLAHKYELSSCL